MSAARRWQSEPSRDGATVMVVWYFHIVPCEGARDHQGTSDDCCGGVQTDSDLRSVGAGSSQHVKPLAHYIV